MSHPLKKLTIEGFKSIRKLEDFELRPLNILIGANGAGKSNFVGFFRVLRDLIDQKLQVNLATEGGADAFLYLGPKVTRRLVGKFYFAANGYEFELVPTADGRMLVFAEEATTFRGDRGDHRKSLGSGHLEAKLRDWKDDPGLDSPHGVPFHVFDSVSNWVVYHFHDTSATAGVRRQGAINVNATLQPDASNLAAFLFRIQNTHPAHYRKIREVVQLAAPFFDDFKLRPDPINEELIRLEWLQKGSDYQFRASQLSDGTLRFICLAAALLQPSRPATVLFDEPELGLHPYALTLLADLFRKAANQHSNHLIVSTQSALLLNEFEPEDIVVVERIEGQSTFRRLERDDLSEWLKEYTLGELWQKNVLGGRPHSEQAKRDAGGNRIPGATGHTEVSKTGDKHS